MSFENIPVKIADLPSVEDLDLNPPDPAYLRVSLIGLFISFGIMLAGIAGIFAISEIETTPILAAALPIGWLVLLLLSIVLTYLAFKIMGYAIREKDVLFRKGVIFRSLVTVPFNRIQHCEIKEGPVERLFGLKTLEIFTAGGQSSDVSIPGLKGETAQQLKEFIIKNAGQVIHEGE